MFGRAFNIGFILLAIYLIIVGLGLLVPAFAVPAVVLGIIALLAGIFLIIGR
jgi:uncharacterized membrane protein HdeD (DUF308 family)